VLASAALTISLGGHVGGAETSGQTVATNSARTIVKKSNGTSNLGGNSPNKKRS